MADTIAKLSMNPFTTILVLICILLQALFGGLHSSVVICLGGGHDHQAQEIVEACCTGCSHDNQWPAPRTDDEHDDDCGCTDIELALITLLMTPPGSDHDLVLIPASSVPVLHVACSPNAFECRGPPPSRADDPGGSGSDLRLAIVRSTHLII